MGISPKDFLNRYFNSKQLKKPLEGIGLPFGSTKKERVNRILENWISHHRNWYGLLDHLDWNKLAKICDDFNIRYSGYEREDTLRNKIEDAMVLDFRKETLKKVKTLPTQNLSKNKIQKTKLNPYVIYPLIAWMFVGIIFATLNFSGMFIKIHDEEIDITKKYQVSYESWIDENTLSGIVEGMSLSGKIILQSTQFSAQNKIDVHIELSPNAGSDIEDMMLLDSIAPPFNVYFVGAQHFDIEDDKPLANILLKRSSDRTKLMGTGSIIYSKGDNHEIYVLDSSENALKQKLLTVNDSPNSIILFPVLEKTLNPNGYFDEDGNELKIPTRVELTSTTEPYLIEIKQSDAQNSLDSDKMNAFGTWIILALIPLTIIPVLKYLPTNKLTLFKS